MHSRPSTASPTSPRARAIVAASSYCIRSTVNAPPIHQREDEELLEALLPPERHHVVAVVIVLTVVDEDDVDLAATLGHLCEADDVARVFSNGRP